MNVEVLSKIADGSYGSCYKVKYNNTICCQKIVDLCNSNIDNEDVKTELSILGKVEHDNIIKLISYNISPELKVSYFMELCFCSLENLRTIYDKTEFLRKRISVPTCLSISSQILSGLNYLHNLPKKIIHLDIKDSNILITETGIVKIIDFGLAVELDESDYFDNEMRGTYEYTSPENRNKDKTSTPSDVWSFGILLYEMMFGVVPKPTHNSYERRTNEILEKMEGNDIQKETYKLLFNNIFKIEPNDRTTTNKLLQLELFNISISNSKKIILKEPKLLEFLHDKVKIFKNQIKKEGCLDNLTIENSSDSDSEYDEQTYSEEESGSEENTDSE